ncbi:hypothetical protein CSUI_007918 [Cystoisospora suis]|uniref:Uncharacterized protein n=1 Tax=Cystoisospora suis TaxID=483139 RepID=A0A2C6KP14_9APIC|nr:hypothetical protein CSUI_007918 [Cystoisospora suis]
MHRRSRVSLKPTTSVRKRADEGDKKETVEQDERLKYPLGELEALEKEDMQKKKKYREKRGGGGEEEGFLIIWTASEGPDETEEIGQMYSSSSSSSSLSLEREDEEEFRGKWHKERKNRKKKMKKKASLPPTSWLYRCLLSSSSPSSSSPSSSLSSSSPSSSLSSSPSSSPLSIMLSSSSSETYKSPRRSGVFLLPPTDLTCLLLSYPSPHRRHVNSSSSSFLSSSSSLHSSMALQQNNQISSMKEAKKTSSLRKISIQARDVYLLSEDEVCVVSDTRERGEEEALLFLLIHFHENERKGERPQNVSTCLDTSSGKLARERSSSFSSPPSLCDLHHGSSSPSIPHLEACRRTRKEETGDEEKKPRDIVTIHTRLLHGFLGGGGQSRLRKKGKEEEEEAKEEKEEEEQDDSFDMKSQAGDLLIAANPHTRKAAVSSLQYGRFSFLLLKDDVHKERMR